MILTRQMIFKNEVLNVFAYLLKSGNVISRCYYNDCFTIYVYIYIYYLNRPTTLSLAAGVPAKWGGGWICKGLGISIRTNHEEG